jgi:hypothetical protein
VEEDEEKDSLKEWMYFYPLHQAFALTACPAYDFNGYQVARNRLLRRTRVAFKGFEEVNGFGQTAETVFAGQPLEQAEEANQSVALGRCLSYPFGNCLGDTLEPFRLDSPENALGW